MFEENSFFVAFVAYLCWNIWWNHSVGYVKTFVAYFCARIQFQIRILVSTLCGFLLCFCNEKWDQAARKGLLAGINLHVWFPCQIWHAWLSMCVLGYIFFISMDFSMCVVLFGLSLTFLVSIEVMGSHVLVELGCWMDSYDIFHIFFS